MAAPEEDDVDLELEEKVKKVIRPERRIAVKEYDTPKAMREEIIEMTQTILDNLPEGVDVSHKEIAFLLKSKLDEVYGPTWHAIVGTHFGGNVTHDAESLLNFSLDKVSFLVLRSGPPDRPPPPAMDGEGTAGGAE